MSKGFKIEVLADNVWTGNAVVWPDKESADNAGLDLLMRWTVPSDVRSVEVDEEPNRPTWAEWCER
jgi:hypothetical protein